MRPLPGALSRKQFRLRGGILSLVEGCRLTMRSAKQIHAVLVVSGAMADPLAAGKIVSFFAISEAGDMNHAEMIFRSLPEPSIFVWNTMIRAHLERGNSSAALRFYAPMLSSGHLPNNYTFSFVLRACLHSPSLSDGQKLHAQIAKLGWEAYDFVQNELIHLYAARGCVDDARRVFDRSPHRDVVSWTAMLHGYAVAGRIDEAHNLFDRMPHRNAVSWSAMIGGYVQAGMFGQALEVFGEMQKSGTRPNHAGLVGALTASAFLGALDQGRWIHAYIARTNLELDRILGTALVDMYAKCGQVDAALEVFEEMPEKDVFAFTAMISGLSNHGRSDGAIRLFQRMEGQGVRPNEITFICALTACSRAGLIAEGRKIFDGMRRVHQIEPGAEHYGCMVDLLGRAGRLAEAAALVKEMTTEPDAYVLGALLNACRAHGDVDLARETAETLERLGLGHGGIYVLLSNMYASENRWHCVAEVRKEMESKRVSKVPGCSMIEIDGEAREFVAGPGAHRGNEAMSVMLKRLDAQLKVSAVEVRSPDISTICSALNSSSLDHSY